MSRKHANSWGEDEAATCVVKSRALASIGAIKMLLGQLEGLFQLQVATWWMRSGLGLGVGRTRHCRRAVKTRRWRESNDRSWAQSRWHCTGGRTHFCGWACTSHASKSNEELVWGVLRSVGLTSIHNLVPSVSPPPLKQRKVRQPKSPEAGT